MIWGESEDLGGAVFELIKNGDGRWTERLLCRFKAGTGAGAGASLSGLIFDAAGNIYGTAQYGGNGNCNFYGWLGCGVVYMLTPNPDGRWTKTVIHSLQNNGKDGWYPQASLVFDQSGNLYGTTSGGGVYGYGTAFKLTLGSDGKWREHAIHQFTGGKDGATPTAPLIFDAAGNLYSTTSGGGAYGYGIVFRLTPTLTGGWREIVLHSFRNNPGAYPNAGLILDGQGHLYGTTPGNNNGNWGSVLEITTP
jgi:hypothetical protein